MGITEVKRKSIPKKVRIEVYNMYNGHCAYCGCELEYKDMQVDHVESKYWYDGKDSINNYKPACRMCNYYKTTYTLEEFKNQLSKIPERLEKDFIYRLAKKYDLIKEENVDIQFYYEKMKNNEHKKENCI